MRDMPIFCLSKLDNFNISIEAFLTQGQCAYSDQALRPGCEAKDFFDFTCPNIPELVNAHPRYPDPTGFYDKHVV